MSITRGIGACLDLVLFFLLGTTGLGCVRVGKTESYSKEDVRKLGCEVDSGVTTDNVWPVPRLADLFLVDLLSN